jgi:hypothetical protein
MIHAKPWMVATAVLGVALAVLQYLNFSGFCYEQGRFYSDRELEDIAIREQMKLQDSSNPERNHVYKSAEDFRAENPGCCRVFRSGNMLPDSILVRIVGWYVSDTEVAYRANDSRGKYSFYLSDTFMNACGKRLETHGITQEFYPRPQNARR